MFPLGCRILPGKHLHKYSGGANFVELRKAEVQLPSTIPLQQEIG
jgi:hypothetical protein